MDKTPGQIAYEAYRDAVEGRSVYGELLPPFDDQMSHIKEAWNHAAEVLLIEFGKGQI